MVEKEDDMDPEGDDLEEHADDGLGWHIYDLKETSSTETFKWRSIMLMEQGIYLSSVSESRPEVFVRKVNERAFLEKRVVLPWPMLSELMIDDGVMQIEWFNTEKGSSVRSRLKFEESEEALNVAAIVASKKGWGAYSNPSTVWRGLLSHGVGLLLVAGLTWLLLNDASDIEQGVVPDFSGRRVATKVFFWKVAGWLGTTGIWVVGSVAMVTMIVLTIRWYRGRQAATVWRKMQ
jgi:hypothetical protein